MTKFRELAVGDTFDFVGPAYVQNSYFRRCVKTGTRTYTPVDYVATPMRVGSINVEVYHVERLDDRVADIKAGKITGVRMMERMLGELLNPKR